MKITGYKTKQEEVEVRDEDVIKAACKILLKHVGLNEDSWIDDKGNVMKSGWDSRCPDEFDRVATLTDRNVLCTVKFIKTTLKVY